MQKEPTVGAWVEDWFALNSVRWSANTTGGYHNLIYRHIIPGVGRSKLRKLKPFHLNDFYGKLAENGLSARSVWCVHLLLRRILDDACKEGIIQCNPADICKVPASERKHSAQLRQSRIRRYMSAAEDVGVLPIIYIGLTVGLRQCELFTLLWADFDLSHHPLKWLILAQYQTSKSRKIRTINTENPLKSTISADFWSECNYRTWKSQIISMVYRQSARGFYPIKQNTINQY